MNLVTLSIVDVTGLVIVVSVCLLISNALCKLPIVAFFLPIDQ